MLKGNFQFLVIGAGRGGTSLIAGLLDCHSSLEAGLEKFSVDCLMGKKLDTSGSNTFDIPVKAFISAVNSLMGNRLKSRGSNIFDNRLKAFISACKKEAKLYPDAVWGNKITTEQIYGLEEHNSDNPDSKIDILDTLFNKYLKDIKVVFILRDGRTCVNSKVQRTDQSFESACDRWKYSVEMYKFFKTRHFNNICIRFEDLLFYPQTTLESVCVFLEIPYQDAMLKGTNNRKMIPDYRQDKIAGARRQGNTRPTHRSGVRSAWR